MCDMMYKIAVIGMNSIANATNTLWRHFSIVVVVVVVGVIFYCQKWLFSC